MQKIDFNCVQIELQKVPWILALAGPKFIGKSTIAAAIEKESRSIGCDAKIMSLATHLKAMSSVLIKPGGMSTEHKEDPTYGICGKSPRFIMQSVGAWGRETFGENIWVDMLRDKIKLHPNSRIIIDDLRYDNEAKMIRDLGGEVWEVVRKDFSYSGEHSSEKGISEELVSAKCYLEETSFGSSHRFLNISRPV